MFGADFVVFGTVTVGLVFGRDANPNANRLWQTLFQRRRFHDNTLIILINTFKKEVAELSKFYTVSS